MNVYVVRTVDRKVLIFAETNYQARKTYCEKYNMSTYEAAENMQVLLVQKNYEGDIEMLRDKADEKIDNAGMPYFILEDEMDKAEMESWLEEDGNGDDLWRVF